MKKYNKKELEEISKMLNKIKKSSDIVIPNDFYRNAEIKAKVSDSFIQ